MATKKSVSEPDVLKSIDTSLKDLNDFLQGEFFEKIESIDWKLWEIYNIVKTYVETNPTPTGIQAPQVSQPQPSTAEIAAEVAKQLQGSEPEEKKSVVGKLFGK